MGTNVTRTLCTCGSISVIPVFKTEILLSLLEVDLHVLVTISAHFGASLVNLKFPVCSQINQIFLFLFGSLYYYSIISSIVSISQKSSEWSSWDLLLNSSPSFVNRSPPGRRRITARLGAPPTCGAFRSLRNPKKLWSRWLRRKVETKARSRVARKIKVPKKSVSFVSNRTKCFAFFYFIYPKMHICLCIFPIQLLHLSRPKWRKLPPLLRRFRTGTRVWRRRRSYRRRGRNSSGNTRQHLLRNTGEPADDTTRAFTPLMCAGLDTERQSHSGDPSACLSTNASASLNINSFAFTVRFAHFSVFLNIWCFWKIPQRRCES